MILSSDGQVKGSTLSALVERLVAHDVSDPNFVSTFLLTYHSFTSTPELFECMFRRFLILPPAGLSDPELAEWTERKLKPVRLRVYNLFKTWLEQHYVEQVDGDPLGLEMLREFACTTMADYMSNAAEQLVRLIDKRRASQGGLRRMVPNLPHAAPPPMLPRSLSRLRLMDINPQELARQFTLIDSNLFNKVRPIECLKTAWSRKPGDPKAFNGLNTDIAVNVKAMSTLSTQTTLWVTANILLEHEIKRRAAVIKYFIAFAEHCRNLNNFNTLMSVLGALTSVPVERLTRTWQAVHQKSMVVYNQLRQIMRTDRNFAEYRDSLHSCNPPAIPFVGVYLQDLTFIEDGNDDMISSSPGLINFAKRQRTAGTIRDLQQFQNVPYNLTPVAEIQDWLLKRLEELCPNGQSSDRLVEEFWKMSTTLEPKEKDSERVLRLLKESGFL
ncbi:ras GEF [Coemansia reversa NRRL 1564]|uniref:Ras GEF n=1 Tax=Coemansia reversa (strain ATCC 12441 / NRRL 1564) TaxID=763665 RepID=A0A2G5BKF8_COERN|nr:ras GEF [Coemansia reversa NRRL 1564]|eukprot:PIA19481.1 ras GEF [Coemansia reversa NRRL 1564]